MKKIDERVWKKIKEDIRRDDNIEKAHVAEVESSQVHPKLKN